MYLQLLEKLRSEPYSLPDGLATILVTLINDLNTQNYISPWNWKRVYSFLAQVHDYEIKDAVLKMITQFSNDSGSIIVLGEDTRLWLHAWRCGHTKRYTEKSFLSYLATLLQLLFNPCQAIIWDYIGLCQVTGVIKFGKEMSLLELIDKLDES
ncbi:hypothetical protein RhiirB3_489076 [Rhizophagus irregularis]|nr:hypothetical protein RhiirB3_489076 [Rhizophagus irregularis]